MSQTPPYDPSQQPPSQQPPNQPPSQPPPSQPFGASGGFGGTGSGSGLPDAKGFFGALFDFSFSTFITPMIVKFVYVLATVLLGLSYLVFLVTTFSQSVGAGLFVLIVGPVVVVVYLAFIRMTLEFYLAIVRMSQDINQRLPRA